MYAVRKWDEEVVIKWMAVGMVLAMVGMAVVPAVGVGKLSYYMTVNPSAFGLNEPPSPEVLTIWNIVVGVNGLLIATAVGGPIGFAIGLALAVGLPA